MAKKKKDTTSVLDIDILVDDIKRSVKTGLGYSYLPSIMEFVYDDDYLNFSSRGSKLYPVQQIILKCFYRGWPGNEDIALTPDEIQTCKDLKLRDVVAKYESGTLLRELVLVLGRRSGKDFMVGIMALYEALRLLEVPGGCPYKHYGIERGNPIYILTVAMASDQAKILFNEIKERMIECPYFNDKIGDIESDRIWMLTQADKDRNKQLIAMGQEKAVTKGSVVIMSGHSNSDSLLGKKVFALLLDEVASFKVGGITSGDKIYQKLLPSTMDFNIVIGHDENGQPIKRLDSKIMTISSPRAEQGVLYKLYKTAPASPRRLSFRLPTWQVNLSVTEEELRKEFNLLTDTEFAMEFGAIFAGSGGEKFISDKLVNEAIEIGKMLGVQQRQVGLPGIVYYAHLDPSLSSNNYALVIVHAENFVRVTEDNQGGRKRENVKGFMVDHIKIWRPPTNGTINVLEVENYIMSIARRFRLGMVSYDTWNSAASIQKLKRKGIPSKCTPFNKRYKEFIYLNLEQLFANHAMGLPSGTEDASYLEQELKCLKRVFTPTGFKIKPDEEGTVKTDDFCFVGETMVLMGDFSYKRIDEIKKGDCVISAVGNRRRVKKLYCRPNPGTLYQVGIEGSLPLICTGNHPFIIKSGQLKNAEDLRVGDQLTCHTRNSMWTDKTSSPIDRWELATLAGMYFSSGWGERTSKIHLSVADTSEKELGRIYDLIGSCVGPKNLRTVTVDDHGQIILAGEAMKVFLGQVFGSELLPEAKIIPSWIMTGDQLVVSRFLGGLLQEKDVRRWTKATFLTSSSGFACQLRYLLMRCGIHIKIAPVEMEPLSDSKNNILYHISPASEGDADNLYDFLRGQREADYSVKDAKSVLKVNSVERITSSSKYENVYNLEVDIDHTYVTQVDVHNCDALAGACGSAAETMISGYPRSGTVYMPVPGMSNLGSDRPFLIGRGQYSLQQAKRLHTKLGMFGP